MEIDAIDVKLLAELQQDGRLPVVELAQRVGLSATPCARRIHQLEAAGIIQGYAAAIDPALLGLKVRAFVQVKLERHTDENVARFRSALDAIEEVVSCFATTGEHDFLLQVLVPDLESLSDVVLKRLLRIDCVRDVQSSLALETMKRSTRVPLGHLR
ncbi:MAG: Lrp/AsnC family transcriptional regulator [Proteobacteria bacterium]|nr:Lrp/AsnC family transcriptional regulator [Pseudomonadota bacterium]